MAASVSPSAEVVTLGERGALVARAFLKGGGYLGWGSLSGSERVKITVPPPRPAPREGGAQGSPLAHLPGQGSRHSPPPLQEASCALGSWDHNPWEALGMNPEEGEVAPFVDWAQECRDPVPPLPTHSCKSEKAQALH